MDIAHQLKQIGISINEQRLVAHLEDMSGTGLTVTLGDVLHDTGSGMAPVGITRWM
jgi:hypothetical protein